jgi:hypothetical protein
MKERSSSKGSPKRMAKANRKQEAITIGMDLGDKNSCYCVLGEDGQVLREGQVATTRKAMTHLFNSMGRPRASRLRASPYTTALVIALSGCVPVPDFSVFILTSFSIRRTLSAVAGRVGIALPPLFLGCCAR